MRVLTCLVFSLLISCRIAAAQDSFIDLEFIDVGEGDAALIIAGQKRIVIDSGNPIGVFRLINRLRELQVHKLEALILTHPHLDHSGGVFALGSLFEVEAIYDNGQDLDSTAEKDDIFRWYLGFVRRPPRYFPLVKGRTIEMGLLTLSIIWPDMKSPAADWNSNSLVVQADFGKFRALFMGDAGQDVEKVLTSQRDDLRADVLKAAHHGAADTASREFIQRVSPRIIVISVNQANIRGYPAAATLETFLQSGAKIHRTDRDGDLRLRAYLDGTFEIVQK